MMKASRCMLAMAHENPFLLVNAKTGKWGAAGWAPTWKASVQSVNYIPENMVAPNADGTWLRTLWKVSRSVDAKV